MPLLQFVIAATAAVLVVVVVVLDDDTILCTRDAPSATGKMIMAKKQRAAVLQTDGKRNEMWNSSEAQNVSHRDGGALGVVDGVDAGGGGDGSCCIAGDIINDEESSTTFFPAFCSSFFCYCGGVDDADNGRLLSSRL